MKLRPFSEISILSKTSILFVFVSVLLFIILVTTSFFPEAIKLYFWSMDLLVIFGYISWWLNDINVLRTIKKNWWYWYSVLLSVVTAILTIVEITCVIIMHYRIFNLTGVVKIWELQHPILTCFCNSLLLSVLFAWIIQYVVNIVIIIKMDCVSK
jgi:hypothetical protein